MNTEMKVGHRYFFRDYRPTSQLEYKRHKNSCTVSSLVFMGRVVKQCGDDVEVVIEDTGMLPPDPQDGETVVVPARSAIPAHDGFRTLEEHGKPDCEIGVWREPDWVNPEPILSLGVLIRSDYRRFAALGATRPLKTIFFFQGLWATFIYRVSHHLYYRTPFSPLRKFVRLLCQIARKVTEIITGISLPPECRIGEGLYIGHFGTIIVSSLAVIGKNCNLSQGVTLGVSGRGNRRGAPTLGNRVYIAANAVVAGKITIGDDVVIGAGAVVTESVPPRTVIVGNPAQVKSHRGSFAQIVYDGMEKDAERLASMALADNAVKVMEASA